MKLVPFAAVVSAFLLAACSSSGTGGSGSGAPSSASVAASSPASSVAPTSSAPASLEPLSSAPLSSVPVSQPGSVIAPSSVPSVPSGVVTPGKPNQTLTKDDFFQADSWTQALFDVANQRGVSGLKSDGLGCGSTVETELRLEDAYHTLAFSVGQANDSPASDVIMTVTVAVDGRDALAKPVGFNAIQKLSVDVSNANSVKIDVKYPGPHCSDNIYPVIFNATVS